MKKLTAFFVLLVLSGCNLQANDVILYQVNFKKPMIICASKSTQKASNMLIDYFFSATMDVLPVFDPNYPKKADVNICLEIGAIDSDSQAWYKIFWKADTLVIRATNEKYLEFAVQQFSLKFLNYYPFKDRVEEQKNKLSQVTVPKKYQEIFKPAFDYREPYFVENYNQELRDSYHTHLLDENWLIWGHNIRKNIRITDKMLAEVNGKKSEDQLCFSSPELLSSLESAIKKLSAENPNLSKVMIMPDDNALVCTCSRCTALGNTPKSASPAVFTALNKLASKFPRLEFFTTAYITTRNVPDFKLMPNVGVMISTMDFPKGVVLDKTKQSKEIKSYFESWKSVSNNIYLWDYVVHFDHYTHSYPTILTTQQNLKWFNSLGVNGVFLQGNDESKSPFSDLKHFVYSQLLLNPDANVDKLMSVYLNHFYPKSGKLLNEYYADIENKNMQSTAILDIYGGWQPSLNKYVDVQKLQLVYDELLNNIKESNAVEKTRLEGLIFAFSHQILEYRRVLGYQENGIATYDYKTQRATLRKDLIPILERFRTLARKNNIEIISETKSTVKDYHQWYRSEVLMKIHHNRLYDTKIDILSQLDEDYQKPQYLNDGGIGLFDYANNWLVHTVEPLQVEFSNVNLKGANTFEISLLHYPRHKIYSADYILVSMGDKEYKIKESRRVSTSDERVSKVYYQISIEEATSNKVKVVLHPKKEWSTFGMAVDEIVIR